MSEGEKVRRVTVFRDDAGRLDALRVGPIVIEFNKHDTWLPIYASRLLKVGRFQVWRDTKRARR
jgi:hypothetical protein